MTSYTTTATAEPVRAAAAGQTLLGALIALLLAFDVVDWTETQTAVVIGFYVAIVGLWNAVGVRNKVTPA